MIKRMIVLL